MTTRFAKSQKSKVKSQKSKVKKGMQAPKFIYGKQKKCISLRIAQEILRPCYKPLNLFMGFLLLTFDF